MELLTKLRANDVKRWNMVNTTRQQTVAEHSFNVALIALDLTELIEEHIHDFEALPEEVIYFALHHDLLEVHTGDIPTPTKNAIMHMCDRGMYNDWEKSLDPDIHADLNVFCGATVRRIIKCADVIEAVWFLNQYGMGNHAISVKTGLRQKLPELAKDILPQHGHVVVGIVEELCERLLIRWPFVSDVRGYNSIND